MSGPIGSSQWIYNPSTSFYDHTIDQSLRFDAAGYLTRNTGEAGNTTVYTTSFWIKRSNLTSNQFIFSAGPWDGGNNYEGLRFVNDDTLRAILTVSNSTVANFSTNAVFRDASAWYHVVWQRNGQAYKIYVNGTEQTYSASTFSSNPSGYLTANTEQLISGRLDHLQDLDGYLAEFHFVDGSALDPTSFGEISDGTWIPKSYSGSYGTTGFHLNFSDDTSIGADTSGLSHNFTVSGLVASDVVPDSPTNNWSILNALKVNDRTQTFAEGNLDFSSTQTSTNPAVTSTFAVTSGKWYWEVYIRAQGNAANSVGIASNPNDLEDDTTALYSKSTAYSYQASGSKRNNANVSYGDTWTTGDIIGVALDLDAGALYFYKNGTIQNSGTAAYTSLSGEFTSYSLVYSSGAQVYNFGQDDSFAGNKTSGSAAASDGNGLGTFYYSVPSGYNSLCASNLPDITIGPGQDSQADDHFNTVLYTGTGSSQSITGVGFQPDFVWIKGRAARRHMLFDVIRGATNRLISDDDNYEVASSDTLTAFNSDGFTEGGNLNTGNNTESYVAWNWKAGGSPSSNSNGSITSSVSANTDAGFSIVSFTGTGSNATVGHGLGSAPEMVIVKRRTSPDANWFIFHKDTGATAEVVYLNLTNKAAASAAIWNSTAPTNDVFSLGTGNSNTASKDYIAYCFHSVEGYSKVGTYVGNASTDGPFVFTNFRPSFFLVRRESSASNWTIFDNKRGEVNEIVNSIDANLNNVEETGTSVNDVDFLSNGIKIREDNGDLNGSGGIMIYLCFAEAPFKFANAR